MIKTSAPNEQTVEKTSFLAFHFSEPVLGGVIQGTKESYEIDGIYEQTDPKIERVTEKN